MTVDMDKLAVGTRVRTVRPDKEVTDWTPDTLKTRRWNVTGTVIKRITGHGLCYEVRHDDQVLSAYEPQELQVLPRGFLLLPPGTKFRVFDYSRENPTGGPWYDDYEVEREELYVEILGDGKLAPVSELPVFDLQGWLAS